MIEKLGGDNEKSKARDKAQGSFDERDEERRSKSIEWDKPNRDIVKLPKLQASIADGTMPTQFKIEDQENAIVRISSPNNFHSIFDRMPMRELRVRLEWLRERAMIEKRNAGENLTAIEEALKKLPE